MKSDKRRQLADPSKGSERQLKGGAPHVGRVPYTLRRRKGPVRYNPQPQQEDQDARLRELAEHGEREELERQEETEESAADEPAGGIAGRA